MRSAYWQTGVDAAGGGRLQRFTFQMHDHSHIPQRLAAACPMTFKNLQNK